MPKIPILSNFFDIFPFHYFQGSGLSGYHRMLFILFEIAAGCRRKLVRFPRKPAGQKLNDDKKAGSILQRSVKYFVFTLFPVYVY